MECYLTFRKDKIMQYAYVWVDLRSTMMSEVSQRSRGSHKNDLSHMRNIRKYLEEYQVPKGKRNQNQKLTMEGENRKGDSEVGVGVIGYCDGE